MSRRADKLVAAMEEDLRDQRREKILARVKGCLSKWELREGPAGYSLRTERIVAGVGLIAVLWTEPGYAMAYAPDRGARVDLRGQYYDWHDIEQAIASAVRRIRTRPKRRPPNKSRRTGPPVCRLAL